MLASPCLVWSDPGSRAAFRDYLPLLGSETAARNPDGRRIRERDGSTVSSEKSPRSSLAD